MDLLISPETRAKHRPAPGFFNVSMDFNAAPSGSARGTEVIIPDNAPPEVRAAAERYNQQIAAFAARNGIENYPVRGVRTRSENGRGVPHTIHAEPFFNSDTAFQEAVKANPAEFAAIYKDAFGAIPNARLIAPHGVGKDRGAASPIFGDETTFGQFVANAALGQDFTLPELAQAVAQSTQPGSRRATVSTRGQAMEQGGLLGMIGQQEAPRADGILGMLFPKMSADRADKIRLGMLGSTLNPNQAAIAGIQASMAGRQRDAHMQKAQQVQAQQQAQEQAAEDQRRQRALEFISQQPGGEMFAKALAAGGDTNQVLNGFLKTQHASNDPSVQSSAMLPDQSGTVMTLRDGSLKIVTVGGDTLAGQEAMDFVRQSQEQAAEFQRSIYKARASGTDEADMTTGGTAEEAKAAGAARGKAGVESERELAEMQRNQGSLEVVVDELFKLADTATYTAAGQIADETRKQLGQEPSEGAIARSKYIAMVDNQVLPLLRQTFGSAFTADEGNSLRATLGDPNKSPAEKKVVLEAFIEQKRRDLAARGGVVQTPDDTGNDLSADERRFLGLE